MATVRDIIFECENYEYSQEYYDFLKECAEIQLMEKYLENQEFRESVNTDGYELSEGALIKPLDISKKEEVKESLGKRMWKAICNFFKAIGRLFKKFGAFLLASWEKFAKFAGITKTELAKLNEICDGIKDVEMTDQIMKGMTEVLDKCAHHQKGTYVIKIKKDIRVDGTKLKIPDVFSKLPKQSKQLFMAVYTPDPIYFDVKTEYSNITTDDTVDEGRRNYNDVYAVAYGPVDLQGLKDLFIHTEKSFQAIEKNPYKILLELPIRQKLIWARMKRDGFLFDPNASKSDIEAGLEKLHKFVQLHVEAYNAASEKCAWNGDWTGSISLSIITQLLATYSKMISKSMNVYLSIFDFRSYAPKAIRMAIQAIAEHGKKKGDNDDDVVYAS